MSRVEENKNLLKSIKPVSGKPEEIQLKLLNNIGIYLADISMSLAVIADCEQMRSMSMVTTNDSLTVNEKRALAKKVLECMMNGDLDGAAMEIKKHKDCPTDCSFDCTDCEEE